MSLVIHTSYSAHAQLSDNDLLALSTCDFKEKIVGIKKSFNNDYKVVILSKSDITRWQLFLRVFGRGNLAHTQTSLSAVSSHLSKFDWQPFSNSDENSNEHKAYLKVCTLANKALCSKNETALFERVATQSVSKMDKDYLRNLHLLINPEMQIKHIEAYLRKELGLNIVKIQNKDLDLNKKIVSKDLKNIQITLPCQRAWCRCCDSWASSFNAEGFNEIDL